MLVDCGMNSAETWSILEKEFGQRGLHITDLAHVFVTHAHIDHMGMAGRLAQEAGATIWVNPYTLPWTKNLDRMWQKRAKVIENVLIQEAPPDWDNPMLRSMNGFFQQALACWSTIPESALRVYEIGDRLDFGGGSWEALYVPGHSNSQSCFYERTTGWLFSADMLLPQTPTPAIEMKVDDPDEREISILRLLASFKEMKELPIKRVFPGHGAAFENHRQLIDNQVARIYLRKAECLRVIQKGQNSFFEIFQQIYPGAFNIFTLSMLKGYLDLLEADGTIKVDTTLGFRRYMAS